MEELNIKGKNYPTMLIDLLVDLHAKQVAQTNLLVQFLSSISNQPIEDLMDKNNKVAKVAAEEISKALYSEYGDLPKDVKDFLSGNP